MEQELAIVRLPEQPACDPPSADRPGSLDLPADILEPDGDEAGGLGEPMVFGRRSHYTQSALAADRFQQESPLPDTGRLPGQPGADDEPAGWLEDPGDLGEEGLEVGHVFGALNRDDGVEGGRLEPAGQPVAQEIGWVVRPWLEAQGVLVLGPGDREGRDPGAVLPGQGPRSPAVTTAHVADPVPGLHLGLRGDLRDQAASRLIGRLPARLP